MDREALEKINFACRLLTNAQMSDAPFSDDHEYVYLCGYYNATITQVLEVLSQFLEEEVKHELN